MSHSAIEFNARMMAMPKDWRYRWCGGDPRDGNKGLCACMGCANLSGELGNSPEIYERWLAWVKEHPE